VKTEEILEILERQGQILGIIDWTVFILRKKEKVVKTASHKIYSDVTSAGKKKAF